MTPNAENAQNDAGVGPDVRMAALPPRHSTGFGSTIRLLLRAKIGDSRAVDLLFRRLIPEVRGWATGKLPRWARRRVDTDDLVQDAFVKLHGRLPKVNAQSRDVLAAYLRSSILNHIRDEVRRAGKVEVEAAEGHQPVDVAPGPFETLAENEERRRYRAGVARLTPEQQELVVGRLELGYSYEQLALVTSRPSPAAARAAVRRAVLRLADVIDEG